MTPIIFLWPKALLFDKKEGKGCGHKQQKTGCHWRLNLVVRGFQAEWEYVRPSSTIANTQCIKAGSGHRQVKLVAWKPELFLLYIWFVFEGMAFHPRHLLVKHPAKCSFYFSQLLAHPVSRNQETQLVSKPANPSFLSAWLRTQNFSWPPDKKKNDKEWHNQIVTLKKSMQENANSSYLQNFIEFPAAH